MTGLRLPYHNQTQSDDLAIVILFRHNNRFARARLFHIPIHTALEDFGSL